ncbi:MAG: 3'-5' exonuclease [Ignavibacteriae bacterium]|nr:3'-5' exonuclease [Ignavibacteriota bacterium]
MDLVNPSHRLTVQGGGDIERLAAAVNQVLDRAQSLREQARDATQGHGAPAAHDHHAAASGPSGQNDPDTPLTRLSCTAFDTEATGLQPSAGDEIIAIGAVRIVNGRLHHEERFDQLVDPRRSVPEESVRVHGIDDDMLAGGPTIDVVLPRFAAFANGTVLVAHNAAFDMRLFEIKRELTGITFAGPVLDTMLLSSVLHPHHEDHTLEGLAKRLGIPVVGRHTALGDALMTGEVFLKLVPLLADKGIVTLRQAVDACARSPLAGLKY